MFRISDVRPLSSGSLPYPAYAVVAPHIARQELIVEAALTGQRVSALAALTTDPLVVNLAIAESLMDELWDANQPFIEAQP
jgi:alpha-galactosidase